MPEDNAKPADAKPVAAKPEANANLKLIPEIVDKVNDAKNILIALSSNPSVDEMASAIGLSLFLDKLGKRATAIYSGTTPNTLEFLKPEETFEPSVDSIQDFVIALSKDKADHLRYKLDGDFVKIFITPYKTRISEEDLDYSYGDFNIDLVLALNVANGIDLDGALREHGRIMHDAVIVDITTGNPGKLGEIEWSDKKASSVSEMITKLIYSMEDKDKLGKEEATAFLTGIVAATNRFSNAKTTAESMRMASRLMESGADQQLISKNITADTQNEIFNMMGSKNKASQADAKDAEQDAPQDTPQDIPEDIPEEIPEEAPETAAEAAPEAATEDATEPAPAEPADDTLSVHQDEEPSLLDDLKAAEASLAEAPVVEEVVPETTPEAPAEAAPAAEAPAAVESPAAEEPSAAEVPQNGFISDKPEKVIQPTSSLEDPSSDTNKYEQMVEDALASAGAPSVPSPAPMPPQPVSPMANPAAISAPAVPANPEINGVPQMNYMPMPSDQVLPPPPTPPIDMAPVSPMQPIAPEPMPAPMPAAAPVAPVAPAVPETPVAPMAPTAPIAPAAPTAPTDPSAFQIPGM